ncbi:MAG: hypothetical protein PUD59_06505 [bacterium]|nr:hypothetical protein [bacterium]
MKIDDFKHELFEQKKQNELQIDLYNKKSIISKVNKFEHKAGLTAIFSMVAYVPVFFITAILGKNFNDLMLSSGILNYYYPSLLVGCSLGIGSMITHLIQKKYQVKSIFKSFSKSKNECEKLEEEIRYEIEKEKLRNKNKVIDNLISCIDIDRDKSNLEITSKENIIDNQIIYEEMEKRINKLLLSLEEQNNLIDILSSQKVLNKRFLTFREQFRKLSIRILNSMVVGVFILYLNFPAFVIGDSVTYSSALTSLMPIIAPFTVGIICSNVYTSMRNKKYEKVFRKINSELEENSLDEIIDNSLDEERVINESLNQAIKLACNTTLELKKEQLFLEEQNNEENKTMNCLEDYNKVKEVIIDNETFNYSNITTDELSYDESGPRLVKRMKNKVDKK